MSFYLSAKAAPAPIVSAPVVLLNGCEKQRTGSSKVALKTGHRKRAG